MEGWALDLGIDLLHRLAIGEMLGDGVFQGLQHHRRAIAGIGALDDLPGGMALAGMHDQPFGGADELVVLDVVLPVGLGDLPRGQRVLLQPFQALLLGLLRQMHPEFENQRPLIGQGLFEMNDALEIFIQFGNGGLAEHMIDQRRVIPGRHEQADLALGRQVAPIAPVFRPFALLVRGLAIGPRHDPAWVHPFIDQVDRLVLARAIHAGEQHDDREIGEAQLLLQCQ